jgi:tRNA pseudouridine32 synthase/23S rRNA pseudouridine746 synthase
LNPAPPVELTVLFANEALLIINKPGGLLSVPGRGPDKQDCVIHRAQVQFPDALVVHRLDMATSGLLLLARGAEMQRRLSLDFAERRVHKRYLALLQGELASTGDKWAEVNWPLSPDWPNRPRQHVDLGSGKASLTRYRVLSHSAGQTRVELEPVSGRTHQLRVHMLSLGFPVVGDALYNPLCLGERCPAPRLMLHACSLHLPELGLQFKSPPEF